MTSRSESTMRADQGVLLMTDLLARIEAALARAEAAADRLSRRHRGLRSVAGDTVAGLDRLIETERRKTDRNAAQGQSANG